MKIFEEPLYWFLIALLAITIVQGKTLEKRDTEEESDEDDRLSKREDDGGDSDEGESSEEVDERSLQHLRNLLDNPQNVDKRWIGHVAKFAWRHRHKIHAAAKAVHRWAKNRARRSLSEIDSQELQSPVTRSWHRYIPKFHVHFHVGKRSLSDTDRIDEDDDEDDDNDDSGDQQNPDKRNWRSKLKNAWIRHKPDIHFHVGKRTVETPNNKQ